VAELVGEVIQLPLELADLPHSDVHTRGQLLPLGLLVRLERGAGPRV
jgi:hypothetical protein